jgi:hypothetical protein
VLGLGVVVVAFLSVWCLAFLNAKPAWREDDDPDAIRIVNTPM